MALSVAIPPAILSVGQVAKRSGVPVSALHFYEAKGLIGALRSDGNQRRFHRSVLRRIAIIRVAQQLGFSLAEIAALLAHIPLDATPTVGQVQEMTAEWRAAIQSRIDGLTALRDHLDQCIGCGCLSQKDCPLRNPADHLGRTSHGPVRLNAAAKLQNPSEATDE